MTLCILLEVFNYCDDAGAVVCKAPARYKSVRVTTYLCLWVSSLIIIDEFDEEGAWCLMDLKAPRVGPE